MVALSSIKYKIVPIKSAKKEKSSLSLVKTKTVVLLDHMLTQAQSVWQFLLCVKSKQTRCLTFSSYIGVSSLHSPYHQVRESMCVQRLPIRNWLPRRQQQEKLWSLQSKPIYLSDVEEEQPASVVYVRTCRGSQDHLIYTIHAAP